MKWVIEVINGDGTQYVSRGLGLSGSDQIESAKVFDNSKPLDADRMANVIRMMLSDPGIKSIELISDAIDPTIGNIPLDI